MEKVNVLVKLIAVFQSVEGVSAKLAEEDEEEHAELPAHVALRGLHGGAGRGGVPPDQVLVGTSWTGSWTSREDPVVDTDRKLHRFRTCQIDQW